MRHLGTVTIETERLILRAFEREDADAMLKNWASDPRVTRCLTWAPHKDEGVTRRVLDGWLREYSHGDFYEWAIVPKDLGEPVGSIGIMELSDDRKRCEAGYCLGAEWWGKGYATEALQAVLDLALNVIGYRGVVAKHAVENPASGRVMQKAGMSMRIGDTVQVSTVNGIFDCIVYEKNVPKKKGLFRKKTGPADFYRILW